jgi:tetratricopeptide (TPR) repeat protein
LKSGNHSWSSSILRDSRLFLRASTLELSSSSDLFHFRIKITFGPHDTSENSLMSRNHSWSSSILKDFRLFLRALTPKLSSFSDLFEFRNKKSLRLLETSKNIFMSIYCKILKNIEKILKNIEKHWKNIENTLKYIKNYWKILKKYWKILKNIEKILKKYWKILKNIEKTLKYIKNYWKILKNYWKILKNIEKILTSINIIEGCSPNSTKISSIYCRTYFLNILSIQFFRTLIGQSFNFFHRFKKNKRALSVVLRSRSTKRRYSIVDLFINFSFSLFLDRHVLSANY